MSWTDHLNDETGSWGLQMERRRKAFVLILALLVALLALLQTSCAGVRAVLEVGPASGQTAVGVEAAAEATTYVVRVITRAEDDGVPAYPAGVEVVLENRITGSLHPVEVGPDGISDEVRWTSIPIVYVDGVRRLAREQRSDGLVFLIVEVR